MFNWNKIQSTETDQKDSIEFSKIILGEPFQLMGEIVVFNLISPNYWEGYYINNWMSKKPNPKFQMRRESFGSRYIVEYFNTNQRAIAIPLNSPQDVISVLDISIKLGVRFDDPK